MAKVTNEQLLQAVSSPRFSALAHTGLAVGDFNRYDAALVREPRLLVPVDVQALVVRAGDEPMVRLPFRTETDLPPVIGDPGKPRPPGVHLWWRVPTAFGRGKVVDDPTAPGDPTRRVLQLPVLPDRWVVVRTVVPVGARDAIATGWVLEADSATVTPLADYPTATAAKVVGVPVPADRLTVHVGGPSWTATYDASLGRHSLHDPLIDLDTLAPAGLIGDAISYTVAGWWNDPRHDPLDGVGSLRSYVRRLAELGWNDPDHPVSERVTSTKVAKKRSVSKRYGITVAGRYTTPSLTGSTLIPAKSAFAHDAIVAAAGPSAPTRATMLHGRIHGVPLRSTQRPDDRPTASTLTLALGPSAPSVAAVLSSGSLGGGPNEQRAAERLLVGFSNGLLRNVADADTWAEMEHCEHALGFASEPGGIEAVDHLVDRPSSAKDPGSAARPGRRTKFQTDVIGVAANILWAADGVPSLPFVKQGGRSPAKKVPSALVRSSAARASGATAASLARGEVVRDVERPAPPFHRPVAPVLAVVGGGRTINAAERDEADGQLQVRTSDHPVIRMAGVYEAADLLRSLSSGAIPDEVLGIVRESLSEDPYLAAWRSTLAAGDNASRKAITSRLRAESAINHAYYTGDAKRLSKITGSPIDDSAPARQYVVDALLKHSLVDGVWTHPEGVTMWGQPWRPLFCDWEINLDLASSGDISSWLLGDIDLDRPKPFDGGEKLAITGRSPLVASTATGVFASVERWLADEQLKGAGGHGLAAANVRKIVPRTREHLREVDVLSVTLDGIRETLLGLAYDRGLVRAVGTEGDDGAQRALAIALPRLVAAGRLQLGSARLVDAFGRTLELPVAASRVVANAADPTRPAALLMRPRLPSPARLHLRLVDPLATGGAATAFVDQTDPVHQINPVAGFLLPDHIDEALEIFDTAGTPLGQLSHEPFSDAVFWEGAPGRTDIGPAAGPTDDPNPNRQRLGWIAAAMVAADATARQATPNRPETESPLSAMLRTIDTTLWTVDPLGSMGREHIAGLVGRPIVVVTAHLTLDVPPDTDQYVYASGTSAEQRAAVFTELAAVPFEVRLGAMTRNDDGLLGYFVDDNYSRFYAIDPVVAERAIDSGRNRGHLSVDGVAAPLPVDNPYVAIDGTVTIRYGQTIRLTLLMHPGGKVHLTSGILPRSSVALARDWVQPGLSRIAPSVRCGPLLIDADKVRLPKVASFPAEQLFTRRDSPGSWRDDPILSATQSAYLPDEASEVQEGWIRIAPNPTGGGE